MVSARDVFFEQVAARQYPFHAVYSADDYLASEWPAIACRAGQFN